MVSNQHLKASLQSTRPSVSLEERFRLSFMSVVTVNACFALQADFWTRYSEFVSDRSGNLPVPPNAGGVGSRASLG
jgi:peroxin-1